MGVFAVCVLCALCVLWVCVLWVLRVLWVLCAMLFVHRVFFLTEIPFTCRSRSARLRAAV